MVPIGERVGARRTLVRWEGEGAYFKFRSIVCSTGLRSPKISSFLNSARHPREGGDPASHVLDLKQLGSRLRGNDGKMGSSAHKVGDGGADGFLSGKFGVVALAVAQRLPQFGFG